MREIPKRKEFGQLKKSPVQFETQVGANGVCVGYKIKQNDSGMGNESLVFRSKAKKLFCQMITAHA